MHLMHADRNSSPTLLLDDQSAETTFGLPFETLSSSMLHFYRSLKLLMFQRQDVSELTLTKDQATMASRFSSDAPSLANGYKIMRVVESMRRQRMMDLSDIYLVDRMVKRSPRVIKAQNQELQESLLRESSKPHSVDPAGQTGTEHSEVNGVKSNPVRESNQAQTPSDTPQRPPRRRTVLLHS